jgi:UPF0489 domain
MASSSQPSTSKTKTAVAKGRKFTKIPVFIVENHNDVLELLLPSLANRYLPFQGNLLIHFDSHPDMCLPRQMPAKIVYERQTLLESLSIENWIMPVMFAEHINETVWIRPSWARQMPDGCHKFKIGENQLDGKINVNSTLDYFLSDGGYKEEKFMTNCKEVTIHVSEVNESLNDLLSDDDEKHWILDIDLDYFSTLNPFLQILPKAETYEKLRAIYKVDKTYDTKDPASVTEYVNLRNRQLDFFETVFQHMALNGSLEKFKCDDPSIDSLCHHYSIYEVDWFLVNDAGCTCDEEEFQVPNHESTDATIKEMILKFEKFLKSLKKPPTLITIARSSLDGYTPLHQVDSIQAQVLIILRKVYAESLSEETLWYKNESTLSALDLVQPRKR